MVIQNQRDYSIATVDTSLDIIEFLAQEDHERSLAQIAAGIGLSKSSAFRHLVTLEKRGYVERLEANSCYRIGTRIFQIANRTAGRLNILNLARPHMQRLLRMFTETVNLGIVSQSYVVYLDILESTNSIRMAAQVGARDHPHSTALGKAILAWLSESEVDFILARAGMPRQTEATITTLSAFRKELARVRADGYATDFNENENGVSCIGAPILNHLGQPVAALSISTLSDRVDRHALLEMGPALLNATHDLSVAMGHVVGGTMTDTDT